jgi:hypothetical protein
MAFFCVVTRLLSLMWLWLKRSFRGRPVKEYLLFSEAWILLFLSRCFIFFIPFRKLLPLLGHLVSQEEAETICIDSVMEEGLLSDVRSSILRASRRCPWRTKCFE